MGAGDRQRTPHRDVHVDEWFGAVTDAGGNAIVLARSQPMVRKLAASNGAFLWSTTLAGNLVASAVDGSGNVFVAGTEFGGASLDIALYKLDAVSGQPIWRRTFDGPLWNDEAIAVAVDGSNNAIVVGRVVTPTGWDVQVLKYAGAGTLLWSYRYDGAAHLDDSATAIAVDADGNVIVAGATGVDGPRFTAFKLAGGDGHLLWAHVVPKAESGGNDAAFAVAIAANGDAVVGGQWTSGSSAGARTLRLASADGGVVWEALEPPLPSALGNAFSGLVLDAADNVLVAPRGRPQRRHGEIRGGERRARLDPRRASDQRRGISPGGDRAHVVRRSGRGGRCGH